MLLQSLPRFLLVTSFVQVRFPGHAQEEVGAVVRGEACGRGGGGMDVAPHNE